MSICESCSARFTIAHALCLSRTHISAPKPDVNLAGSLYMCFQKLCFQNISVLDTENRNEKKDPLRHADDPQRVEKPIGPDFLHMSPTYLTPSPPSTSKKSHSCPTNQ